MTYGSTRSGEGELTYRGPEVAYTGIGVDQIDTKCPPPVPHVQDECGQGETEEAVV